MVIRSTKFTHREEPKVARDDCAAIGGFGPPIEVVTGTTVTSGQVVNVVRGTSVVEVKICVLVVPIFVSSFADVSPRGLLVAVNPVLALALFVSDFILLWTVDTSFPVFVGGPWLLVDVTEDPPTVVAVAEERPVGPVPADGDSSNVMVWPSVVNTMLVETSGSVTEAVPAMITVGPVPSVMVYRSAVCEYLVLGEVLVACIPVCSDPAAVVSPTPGVIDLLAAPWSVVVDVDNPPPGTSWLVVRSPGRGGWEVSVVPLPVPVIAFDPWPGGSVTSPGPDGRAIPVGMEPSVVARVE